MNFANIVCEDPEGSSVGDRHMGGANLLFADGHVEWKHSDFLRHQRNYRHWMLAAQPSDAIFYPHDSPY